MKTTSKNRLALRVLSILDATAARREEGNTTTAKE